MRLIRASDHVWVIQVSTIGALLVAGFDFAGGMSGVGLLRDAVGMLAALYVSCRVSLAVWPMIERTIDWLLFRGEREEFEIELEARVVALERELARRRARTKKAKPRKRKAE